jgi:iron-sulfur cluster repair protein YtfE (RIC family)
MHYERMLAELFGEEDRAREMATRLAEIARASSAAVAAERDSLLAFLRGPIERHFAFEEQAIFPKLVEHDLGPEVQVATKQHDTVRQLAEKLAACTSGDALGPLVFDIARLLLHHTNFEGDYIYPELTHEEWRELMKRTVAENDGAASGPRAQAPAEPQCAGSVPTEPSVNS